MKIRNLVFIVALGLVAAAQADETPTAQQMIEQLKPVPHTRSLGRNLKVEGLPPAVAGQPLEDVKPALTLAMIQFDFNSARVKAESLPVLSNLAEALQSKELQNSVFAVEGHTDAKGSAAYNLKLSQQRAQAVADFLKSKGVDEARLLAAGKGSAELANSEQPFAAENRRVRIVNLD